MEFNSHQHEETFSYQLQWETGTINQKMFHANSYVACYKLLQNIKQSCSNSHKTSLLVVLQYLNQKSKKDRHAR